MIEPTESESLAELDRFVEVMKRIYEEVLEVSRGEYSREDNVRSTRRIRVRGSGRRVESRVPEKQGGLPAPLREGEQVLGERGAGG